MNLEFANLFGIGNPTEVMIIAGVVILLFGGSKIAGFGKSLGDGMKEFKKATREMQDEEPKLATAEPSAPGDDGKRAARCSRIAPRRYFAYGGSSQHSHGFSGGDRAQGLIIP